MNISEVVSSIQLQLGLYEIVYPFKDGKTGEVIPMENVITTILQTVTVPMYSQFVPWMREGTINIQDLKCVNQKDHIYMLPAHLTLTPVMYVSDVSLPYMNTRGTYGDISPAYGISRSVQGVSTSQAYMMLAGQMRSEPTFEYMGFNKIKLYGYPRVPISITVACKHDPSLESIEESCYDSFMELAILDVKAVVYNHMKHYIIGSAHGEINFKIDDWQTAESDKKTLLDQWREVYHLDMGWEKFM